MLKYVEKSQLVQTNLLFTLTVYRSCTSDTL